jgi:hypothetical protein
VTQQEEQLASSKRKGHKIEVLLVTANGPAKIGGEPPHEALANMRAEEKKAVEAFLSRWGELMARNKADSLRLQPSSANSGQVPIFGSYSGLEPQLQNWLRAAWRGDRLALEFLHDSIGTHMKIVWRFRKGQIEVAADDLWSTICIRFLLDHAAGNTTICANPDCQSPYFIRKRSTQKYCEIGPCTKFAQKKSALRWWHRVGKKNRAKKAESRRSKRR